MSEVAKRPWVATSTVVPTLAGMREPEEARVSITYAAEVGCDRVLVARKVGKHLFAISACTTGSRARAQAPLAVLGAVIALVGAGCGGDSKEATAVLRAFFATSERAQLFSAHYPHQPGAVPCTIRVKNQSVNATCATDVTLVGADRAVITLTEAWDHGALAHTWFFFVRRDGVVGSVVQEGSAP